MTPITFKRRDGEGNFTVKVIDRSDIGITITTTPPGKRPKTEVEGYGTLQGTAEERISEIVSQLLGEGYFSNILEGAQQSLDFFSAVFRDSATLDTFLDKARQAGILVAEEKGSATHRLDFLGFSATCKKTIQGLQVTAHARQGIRHQSVPVFYAMLEYAFENGSADCEGVQLDLRETNRVEYRAGRLGPEAISLLESVGAILKPIPASSIGRGRGTKFAVTL